MQTIGLVLEPIDTLFFRSGRPFGAGVAGESELPTPQNFAGAVRSLLLERSGADFERMRGQQSLDASFAAAGASWMSEVRFRGPWLADISERNGPKPLIRTPANLIVTGGKTALLRPLKRSLSGWVAPETGMLPLWHEARADKKRPEWLAFQGLRPYLAGESIDNKLLRPASELYQVEARTGIQIDEGRQAPKDRQIYSTRSLRFGSQIAFYGEIDIHETRANLLQCEQVMSWGGERHHVVVRPVMPVQWPVVPEGPRSSWLLISPAIFAAGWRPDALPAGILRGAAVDGPFAVSGWDMARRGPKPTRFGVAAGSVYFLEGTRPTPSSLCARPDDASAGYGVYLKGSWNYAE